MLELDACFKSLHSPTIQKVSRANGSLSLIDPNSYHCAEDGGDCQNDATACQPEQGALP